MIFIIEREKVKNIHENMKIKEKPIRKLKVVPSGFTSRTKVKKKYNIR